MLFASRFDLYKILVDPIEDGFNFKAKVLDVLDLAISYPLKKQGFAYKKSYYYGNKENH